MNPSMMGMNKRQYVNESEKIPTVLPGQGQGQFPDQGIQKLPGKSYIGKFVCYSQMDGGACFGRIKDECKVNTSTGEKEVFILTDRVVRYVHGNDDRNFRRFFPTGNAVMVGANGNPTQEELRCSIRQVPGDSILYKERIDLDKDILDVGEMVDKIDRERLFIILLQGMTVEVDGTDAVELGLRGCIGDEKIHRALVEELKRRMANDERNGK